MGESPGITVVADSGFLSTTEGLSPLHSFAIRVKEQWLFCFFRINDQFLRLWQNGWIRGKQKPRYVNEIVFLCRLRKKLDEKKNHKSH